MKHTEATDHTEERRAEPGDGATDPGAAAADIAIDEAAPSAASLGLELPDDPEQARVLLLRELSEARSEASEYLDLLQRATADLQNSRRLVERDRVENALRASQRVIESLLPALDTFDAALVYEPQTPAEEKILQGMWGTHLQIMDALAREGFAPIPSVGEAFDPAVHEAVAGGGDGDLVVTHEMRRGYMLRDRVLRPSLVTVAPREAGT